MKARSLSQAQSGFTLVEMLLAMMLMAMLMGLAFGGFRAATKASTSGQQQLEISGKIRATHQFIRRQFNQMQPLPFAVTEDINPGRIVFEGDRRRVRFVAPMPGYLGQGGPQVQTLELVNGNDGINLQFNHELLEAYDPQVGETREPIVLLEDLADAAFSFLARDDQGLLLPWTGAWDQPESLPVAVQLEIDMGEQQRAIWPLLITGVRIDEMATTASGAAQTYSGRIRDMIQNPDGGQQ